ncbi:MAG: polysaccharide deacetylase family protein [Bacteroidales bacterium]|nr:polysaccharide deacetylase family protein [Bacteroidales bacterium]
MKKIVGLPLIILIFIFACNSDNMGPSKKTFMVICFDVEDYTSPESAGMDDIPKWLAEILTEEDITGSFFVIGEKARSMKKRGREDVIKAMAKHDIGSHTNYGSIHPTVTEILEKAAWNEGITTMLKNESAGFNDLEEIFGKRPNTLARHGGSYGPQLVASLSQLGAAFIYSPISLPEHNAIWFCNTLNFHGEGDFGFFDDTYHRDDLFDPLFQELEEKIPELTKGVEVVSFFANHPSKVRSIQFWDFNYYKGANPSPDEWKTPELRPLETMETAKKNFRRLVRYLKEQDDIELTTYGKLAEEFSIQKEKISKEKLQNIAFKVIESESIIIDNLYSPSEIFAALSTSLSNYEANGNLLQKIYIRRPFGPEEMPITEPEIKKVSIEQGLLLASQSNNFIDEQNQLPTELAINGNKIGTGSLLALFCNIYIDLVINEEKRGYQVNNFQGYPNYNEEKILEEVMNCKYWPVHRDDLDLNSLVEMTKRQLWTLKPAYTKKQLLAFK